LKKEYTKINVGEVYLNDNRLSANHPIEKVALPEFVSIPLFQHSGNPAIPIVEKDSFVKTGQLIAKADGRISSNIHSSVTGRIIEIKEITEKKERHRKEIVIRTKDDVWEENIDTTDTLIKEITLPVPEIINRIRDNGVVELNGTAFPLHVKLSVQHKQKENIIIINSAENEAYISSDHRLMLEKGEELFIGTSILMKVYDTNKGIIAIEKEKKDVLKNMLNISKQYPNIEIIALKKNVLYYNRQKLIKTLTGKNVPDNSTDLPAGYLTHNIATTFAVYEAVQKNKPLIERIITVSDLDIKKGANLQVRIGTPLTPIFEKVCSVDINKKRIINGNVIRGKEILELQTPINKKSIGLFTFSKRDTLFKCIRCSQCINACPMGLEPYRLAMHVRNSDFVLLRKEKILNCTNCGTCGYVCPTGRPVLDLIRYGRKKITEIQNNPQTEI